MKTCTRCRVAKPSTEFGIDRNSKDGLAYRCRPCHNEQARISRAALDTDARRRETLKYRYSITLEQFDEMLEAQGGTCATCFETPQTSRAMQVDHDHDCCPGKTTCGKCVRGILCWKCNSALGMVNDNPDRLERLANYLRKFK